MSLSANVQKYSKNTTNGHIEYFIKVFYNGKQWGIWKRYSDFIKLDEYLIKNNLIKSHSILKSRNKWWNRHDTTLLMHRIRELQSYLDFLLTNTLSAENPLIKEFLDIDVNMLTLAKQQSFRELTTADRLLNVCRQFRSNLFNIESVNSNSYITSVNTNINTSNLSRIRSSSKKLSLSSSPSFNGNGLTRVHSLSNWMKRNDSKESFNNSISNYVESKHSVDKSYNSSLTNLFEVQNVILDNQKKESFSNHVKSLWVEKQLDIYIHTMKLSSNSKLPISLKSDNASDILDKLKPLTQNTVNIYNNLINDSIEKYLPRPLTLPNDIVLQMTIPPIYPPKRKSRSKTIELIDNDNASVKTNSPVILRLRKTPSDGKQPTNDI